MRQLDLFGGVARHPAPPVCPTCRRPFPPLEERAAEHTEARETERLAALRQLPTLGTKRAAVLGEFRRAGGEGRTDEELSLRLGMRLYTAAPRRHELLMGGFVRDSGRTRETTTGSLATVWVLSDR